MRKKCGSEFSFELSLASVAETLRLGNDFVFEMKHNPCYYEMHFRQHEEIAEASAKFNTMIKGATTPTGPGGLIWNSEMGDFLA